MRIAVCVLLLGCGGAYTTLQRADQQRFDRCTPPLQQMLCLSQGEGPSSFYCIGAMRDAANTYALQPTRSERIAYLIGQGCPEAMAGYDEASTAGREERGERRIAATVRTPETAAISAARMAYPTCAPSRIAVQSAASTDPPAYWMLVCGAQRYFVWERRDSRFHDRTPSDPGVE
jgi:hypothetical protein